MLEEVIKAASQLHQSLEKVIDQSENQKYFCVDISITLERYSWEIYKIANDLKEIKNYIGV